MHDQAIEKKKPTIDRSLLEDLIKRASEGDESTLPGIRMMLDILPNGARILEGDLAHEAAQALIRAVTGSNLVQKEAICRKMEQIRSELSGPNSSPVERLLVDRVVLCWLHVHHADVQYAYATNVTLEYGDYLQRQQERAQRRYLAAIKSLATVRRLVMPIKVDVTVAGAENQTRPACRRPVEDGHTGATGSGQSIVRRKTVKRLRSRQ